MTSELVVLLPKKIRRPNHYKRIKGVHIAAVVATALIASLIGVFMLAPSIPTSWSTLALTDKAYHAIAFAALVLPSGAIFQRHRAWIATGAFVFGLTIEVVQPLVGRNAEWADIAANTMGILIGLSLGRMISAKAFS